MYKYVCRSNYKQRKNPENRVGFGLLDQQKYYVKKRKSDKTILAAVGFEPTPPKRLVP